MIVLKYLHYCQEKFCLTNARLERRKRKSCTKIILEIDKIACIRLNLSLNGILLYYNSVKYIYNSTLRDKNVWQFVSCNGRFDENIKQIHF